MDKFARFSLSLMIFAYLLLKQFHVVSLMLLMSLFVRFVLILLLTYGSNISYLQLLWGWLIVEDLKFELD